MAHPVDLFILFTFIKRLSTPFNEWRAFKAGVIDDNGHFLVSKKEQSSEQKETLSLFDILILNLKKLLAKIPGGASRIATFAAALLLLREHENNMSTENQLNEVLSRLDGDFNMITETIKLHDLDLLVEDEGQVTSGVPTNNTGNIVTKDGPILTMSKNRQIKKRNQPIKGQVGDDAQFSTAFTESP